MTEELPPRVVVYGAGSFGREFASALRDCGIDVLALLDRSVTGQHSGIPIVHPDGWVPPEACGAVLGLHNPGVALAPVAAALSGSGYGPIISPVQAASWLGTRGADIERYWLTGDVDLYSRERDSIEIAEGLLSDEESRELFDSLIRYRSGGDLRDLPEALPLRDQYFAPDLLERIDLSRIVDCGAFDGDTLRALASRDLSPEWVLALEPDPANSTALVSARRATGLNAVCLPLGAWSGTEVLRFSADGTAASSVGAQGSVTIQAAALDELLPPGWVPTYIKMDIEGAELPALEGARETITKHRPGLAISAYHSPRDLWDLLLWVHRSFPDRYDAYLRQYGENCFDTVLYCLPRS